MTEGEFEAPAVGALHGEGVGRLVGIEVDTVVALRDEVEAVNIAFAVDVAGGQTDQGGEHEEEGEEGVVHGVKLGGEWCYI